MKAWRLRASWPVFPGPVFRRELGSASRGRRLYLFRALVATILAADVGSNVELRRQLWGSGALTVAQIAELGTRAFRGFAVSQLVLVLAMVPLLVAGSLAEEKARGTLGLVLAGRLSSAEIVADKLAARMLTVLVLMAAALPVLALIGLLGGIDPAELAQFAGMTLGSVWMAACLSMLVSVYARSAAGAIVGAYAAMLAWIVLPIWLVAWLGSTGPPGIAAMLRPIAREVARSTPLSATQPREVWGPWVRGPAGRTRMVEEMVGLQAAGGLLLFALAAWRLRPAYRAQVGGVRGRKLGWLSRVAGLRGRPRPPCGDDPMAWKERYSPEAAWLARLTIVGALVLLVRITYQEIKWNEGQYIAFDEMFKYGLDLGKWGEQGGYRNMLNYVLCSKAGLVYLAGLVASAILAASGVAGERSRGTWEGLLSTPLDRRSILRAKRRGAFRAIRVLVALIVFLYLTSLASTAMHPAGFVLGVLAVGAFLWFGVTLGTYVSLRSKNANQAIARTALILLAVNLGPAAVLYPFIGSSAMMATTPMLATELPLSRMRVHLLFQFMGIEATAIVAVAVALGIVLAHAMASWLLTRAADRRIERDLG